MFFSEKMMPITQFRILKYFRLDDGQFSNVLQMRISIRQIMKRLKKLPLFMNYISFYIKLCQTIVAYDILKFLHLAIHSANVLKELALPPPLKRLNFLHVPADMS